ncbi:MAG: GNAT family N-acetyltransferase [Muribaculaceae bacterium]|nr:GNAT family N-acetyltransferase [Muribaculaceae bacterium]
MIEIKGIEDIATLMLWRREVIENVFEEAPSEDLLARNHSYYLRHLADDTHLAFLASVEGYEAGCGSICLTEELPSPDNPSGRCAYLMNIYVRAPFREHGVAHAIVTRLVEEARLRGCQKIYLETTDAGRPVYESLGFRDLPDMMKLKQE